MVPTTRDLMSTKQSLSRWVEVDEWRMSNDLRNDAAWAMTPRQYADLCRLITG